MTGIVCALVGNAVVTAVATVIRKKTSIIAAGSTLSTAQNKFGGSSAIFNGSSQYINVPHQSQLDLSNYTDWTIEGWFYFTEPTSRTGFNKDGITGSAYPGYALYTNSSKQPVFGVGGSAGNWVTITGSSALSSTTWYHFAAVKSGSTITLYKDGTSIGTTTYVGYTDQGRSLYIGWESSGAYMYGHIDEFRISKTARYTTTFTPSTTPFVNDSNTVLLMHMDGTNSSTFFEDDNGVRDRRDFYQSGNTVISTTQSKFGGTSAYFDGADDWLETKYGLELTGDFTVECWVYLANTSGTKSIITIGSENTGRIDLMVVNAALKYDIYASTNATSTGSISATTWTHIAYVRSGSTLTFYIGGTAQGTGTASGTVGRTDQIRIGQHTGTSEDYSGYIDEFRISNTARYTSGFTPSTTPFVNDSNTLLLMHMDGTNSSTVFRDDNGSGRSQLGMQANGNAAISTTQSKFGGTSAVFDATGDYVVLPASQLAFGTGNWCIEGWYRSSVTSGDQYLINFKVPTSQISGIADIDSGNGHWGINIYQSTWRAGAFNNKLVGGVGSGVNTGIDTTTWHHFALVRDSSTTLKYYIDGTQIGSTVTLSSSDNFTPSIAYLGSFYFSTTNTSWNGYLDEIRISNTARYTANFTAPTAPFQNDSNTLLLLHCDGANSSTTFIDDNGKDPTV